MPRIATNPVAGRQRDVSVPARLRELRQARGLTQAVLAGTDFTKGFISQLESGTSRLSLRAAQVLAGRLGVTVAELLGSGEGSDAQLQIRLLEAERELSTGSPELALKMSREFKPAGRFRGRALRLQGRALLELDRADEATHVLQQALEVFRAERDREFYVRTLYDLAFGQARLDRPERSLVLALECQRALEAGELVDRTMELQLESLLASIYARLGQAVEVQPHLERALRYEAIWPVGIVATAVEHGQLVSAGLSGPPEHPEPALITASEEAVQRIVSGVATPSSFVGCVNDQIGVREFLEGKALAQCGTRSLVHKCKVRPCVRRGPRSDFSRPVLASQQVGQIRSQASRLQNT